MKSNKCLFSPAIFKSDLKRFSPYSVLLLIAQILIFPVSIYNNYGADSSLGLSDFASHSAVASGASAVFACVIAMLVFSYLYSSNKCNAMHAFPIGRKALFFTSFAAGYLLLVLPQIIGFALGIPAILKAGNDIGSIILLQTVSIFAESFIYLSIAVLCAMLAGNIFAGTVIYGIVNFAYTAFISVLSGAVWLLGYGIRSYYPESAFTSYLSPVVRLISNKSEEYAYYEPVVETTGIKQYYISVLVLVIAAVVICFIAYALYKNRALECAGDMVVYKAEIPIFSVITSVLGGALAAALLGAIFSFGLVAYIISYVAFALLFYFAAQMIIRKTARVFGVKNFIVWAAVCVVTVGGVFAIANYETNYIPKASAVKSLTVNATYDVVLTSPDEIEKAEQLHKLFVDKRTGSGAKRHDTYNSYDALYEDSEYSMSFKYTLKGNRTVERSYYMNKKDKDEYLALLAELEKTHPPLTVYEQLEDVDFTITGCEIIDYENMPDNEQILLSPDEFDEFYALCAEDAKHITDGYQTQSGLADAYRSDALFITFDCKAKSKEDMKKVDEISYSSYDVTGASVNGLYEDETRFEIMVDMISKDSKILDYIKTKK